MFVLLSILIAVVAWWINSRKEPSHATAPVKSELNYQKYYGISRDATRFLDRVLEQDKILPIFNDEDKVEAMNITDRFNS